VLGKVCCDSPNCGVEWFHFACVGLSASPEGEWLCPVCELLPENVRKTEPTLESPVDANANDGRVCAPLTLTDALTLFPIFTPALTRIPASTALS